MSRGSLIIGSSIAAGLAIGVAGSLWYRFFVHPRGSRSLSLRLNTGCKVLPADTRFGNREYLIIHVRNIGNQPVRIEEVGIRLPLIWKRQCIPVTESFVKDNTIRTGESRSYLIAERKVISRFRVKPRHLTVYVVDEKKIVHWSCPAVVRLFKMVSW